MNPGETFPDIDALIGTVRQAVRRRTGTAGTPELLRQQVLDLAASEGPETSGAFDEEYYRALYPDVDHAVAAGAYVSGLEHWTRHGRAEGRLSCRSLEHASAAGRARLARIAESAAQIGRLPAAPATLRARLGAQAVRLIGRMLAWYSEQLRRSHAAVSSALAEQLSEVEYVAAQTRAQRQQLAVLAGYGLACEDGWQARADALAQSQSGWDSRVKLLARQLAQVEELVRRHEERLGQFPAQDSVAALRESLRRLQAEIESLGRARQAELAAASGQAARLTELAATTAGMESRCQDTAQQLEQLRNELKQSLTRARATHFESEFVLRIERALAELAAQQKGLESRLAEEIQARDRLAGRLTAESLARQIAEEHLRSETAARERTEARVAAELTRVEALERADAERRLQALEAAAPRLSTELQAESQARQTAERRWAAEVTEREQLAHRVESVVQLSNRTHSSLAETSRNTQQVRAELAFQQQRVSQLLEEARRRLPEPLSVAQTVAMATADSHSLDELYVSFEDLFRGTRAEIRERQSVYLPYIRKAAEVARKAPVLDVGCGRGEWLELLRDEALAARGADLNLAMLERCRALSLDVEASDALTFLRGRADESASAVTGFHILEHLSFSDLLAVLDESARVLRPGGVAIFETPNPANLLVGANTFYLDPTHVKPLPSDLLRHLAEARGLCRVEVLRLHDDPAGALADVNAPPALREIQGYLWGPRDYAIIGWKA